MKNMPSREARRKGLGGTANRWDLSATLLALLGFASLFSSCEPAFAQSPAVCVVSGTVLDGGSQPIVGTPVRFRVISPVLASTGAALAVQDLTTTTAAGGAWSLTLVQGLNAQVDIPAVGIAKDTVIPTGASCPALFSSLTLYNRGTLTPATILSTAGPSMGGDLTGSSPNPTVVGLRGQTLAAGACTNGQARVYSSGSNSYTCQTVTTGSGVTSVTGGTGITVTGTTTPSVAITAAGVGPTQLASGAASTNVGTLSGDLSGTLPAPTVAAGAITDAKVNAGAAIAWSKINKAGATAADVGAVASGSAVTSVTAGTGISLSGTGVAPIVNIANGGVTATQLGTGAAASNVGSLGGDFSGTLPNPSIAAGAIVDADVNAAANIAWTKVSKAGAAESDIPGLVADLADKLSKGSGGTVVGNTTFSGTTTFNGAAIFSGSFAPAGEFRVVRTADATSPSPQKVSNNAVFEGSVWNGSAPERRLFSLRNTPTGLNAGKLSFLGYSTDNVVGSELAYIDATTGQYNGPTAGLHTGNVTGNLTGNVTGNVTGTAASFTGNLTGDVTSSAMATTVQTVSGQTAANVAAGAVLANAATALNTASAIVKRDGSNNFAAGTITANLTGNVTGALTGNATTASDGLTSASGTAPLTLNLAAKSLTGSIADASVGAKGVVQLAGDLNGTAASPGVATVGGQTAANVAAGAVLANAATSSNTINTIVKRDGSGNFIAGTITGALAGNATTATNVTMGGDASGNSSAATVTKIQGNPVLAGTPLNGQVYQYVTANGRFEAQTLTGAGTVTSVNASGGTTGFSFTGGPISGSGTLTMTGTLGLANGGTGQTTANASFNALSPMTTLGDVIYGGASGVGTRLAGNTTTTRQFFTSQGSAGLATAPAWGVIVAGDIPNIAATQVTTGWPAGYLKGSAGSLTSQAAPIPVADGGTGATTLASGVIHGNGTSALTSSQVNLATEVTGTLPAAAVGAGFVKVDGSTQLTADWTAGQRNIYSKNGVRVFNVVDGYGADPTFTSDSTAAIQNAVNDAAATVNGGTGATVYIPRGHYKIVSGNGIDITNASGVALYGDGPMASVLDGNGTNPFVIYSSPSSSGALHDIRLRGLRVVNNGGVGTTAAQIWNVLWFTIEDCFFQDVVGTGGALNMAGVGNGALINVQAYADNGPALSLTNAAPTGQACGPLEIHGGEFANQAGVQVANAPAVRIVGKADGIHFVGTMFQASNGTHAGAVTIDGDASTPSENDGTVTFEECHGESNYNSSSTSSTFVIGQTTKFGSVQISGGNYWGSGNGTLYDNYGVRVYAAKSVIVRGAAFGRFTANGYNGGLIRLESGWPSAGDAYEFVGIIGYNLTGPVYSDANSPALLTTSYTGNALGGAYSHLSGNVGIGTTGQDSALTVSTNASAPRAPTAGTAVHILGADGVSTRLGIDAYGSTPALEFRHAIGTNASPSATTSGTAIGSVSAKGYGTTGYPSTGRAQFTQLADELWTDTTQGTRMDWRVTANGSTTLSEQMRLSNDGSLWLSEGTATTQVAKVGGTVFTQTANKVTTANTLTTLFSTGVGSLTLPANILTVGRTIKVRMGGFVSAADGAAGTKTLTLLLGGVTIATATSGATFQTVLNAGWEAAATITARTVGAGGTCIGGARWETQIATANPNGLFAAGNATAACNTTNGLAIDLQFNNGNATGTITTTWAEVEVIN